MTTEVDTLFAEVERRTERTIALVRLAVLLTLGLVYWRVGASVQRYTGMVPLVGLGVTSLIGLAVAETRLFRPWIPWLLATFDVIFLVHCLAMFAAAAGQPFDLSLETPAAWVIFVLLGAAAIRHRPFLVLYIGALFVTTWLLVWALAWPVGEGSPLVPAATSGVARLIIVGLVAFALFIGVRRARQTLIASITEARLRTNLSRYFCAQLSEELAHTGDAARSFQSQKAAVLFADLRGFTAFSERTSATKVAEFLTEYRRLAAEAINQHRGMIDKLIGDGVMAVFGVPRPGPDDARDAVFAGLALVSATSRWSELRVAQGLAPVQIGVGIHYGEVVAGAIGDERRLEYTVIGDTVNVAARIEQLTAVLEEPLLVSAEILAASPTLRTDLEFVELPTSPLRGKSERTRLYRPADSHKWVLRLASTDTLY